MKNKSKNISVLQLTDNREVLLSYGVPVAAFVPGFGYIKRAQRYSVTTSKHANEYCRQSGREPVEVSDEQFLKLIGDK